MTLRTVTLDTNVFPIDDLRSRAEQLGITIAISTITNREIGDRDPRIEGAGSVPEAFLLGESRLDEAVVVGEARAIRLEQILRIVSNGSFPKPGKRCSLSRGQRSQLRDAMALDAHTEAGRDAFVTMDRAAFIDEGRRPVLEQLCGTRILTREEFCALLPCING
jgi:hypothetical protein